MSLVFDLLPPDFRRYFCPFQVGPLIFAEDNPSIFSRPAIPTFAKRNLAVNARLQRDPVATSCRFDLVPLA